MNKIIAVDFDGCLVTNEFPKVGKMILSTYIRLLDEQKRGARIILYTCRVGKMLDEAVDWCYANKIVLSGVNENLQDMIEKFGNDTRKIYADEYWDDRAVSMPDISKQVCMHPYCRTFKKLCINHSNGLCKSSNGLLDGTCDFAYVLPRMVTTWTQDVEGAYTCINCKSKWEFIYGSADENHVRFCQRCGAMIVEFKEFKYDTKL
jgi:hypothetical protein